MRTSWGGHDSTVEIRRQNAGLPLSDQDRGKAEAAESQGFLHFYHSPQNLVCSVRVLLGAEEEEKEE